MYLYGLWLKRRSLNVIYFFFFSFFASFHSSVDFGYIPVGILSEQRSTIGSPHQQMNKPKKILTMVGEDTDRNMTDIPKAKERIKTKFRPIINIDIRENMASFSVMI